MVARNDITGDLIKSKTTMGKEFEDNFTKIFGEKKREKYIPPPLENIQATPVKPVEYAEDWQSSERDRAVAQNGNVGYTEEQIKGE